MMCLLPLTVFSSSSCSLSPLHPPPPPPKTPFFPQKINVIRLKNKTSFGTCRHGNQGFHVSLHDHGSYMTCPWGGMTTYQWVFGRLYFRCVMECWILDKNRLVFFSFTLILKCRIWALEIQKLLSWWTKLRNLNGSYMLIHFTRFILVFGMNTSILSFGEVFEDVCRSHCSLL